MNSMTERCIGFLIDGEECYKLTSYYFKERFISGKIDLDKMELLYVPKHRFNELVLSSFDEQGKFRWNIEKIRDYVI